jgi:hypothetical protein
MKEGLVCVGISWKKSLHISHIYIYILYILIYIILAKSFELTEVLYLIDIFSNQGIKPPRMFQTQLLSA